VKTRGCWIHSLPNVAHICHLVPDTDLYKKQLHCFIINDKITSSGKSSPGGGVTTKYRSQISGSCRMGLTVLLHWGRKLIRLQEYFGLLVDKHRLGYKQEPENGYVLAGNL